MKPEIAHQGACLCGAVKVNAKPKTSGVGICHCAMCRTWGGGPFFAVECEGAVEFNGTESISTFESSKWAERGFCQKCGTHLFYRLKQNGHYAIPVGLFNDSDQWNLSEQIFIDQKPPFYSFEQQTLELTGEEVFAAYFSG